jgi:hypothetical protein
MKGRFFTFKGKNFAFSFRRLLDTIRRYQHATNYLLDQELLCEYRHCGLGIFSVSPVRQGYWLDGDRVVIGYIRSFSNLHYGMPGFGGTSLYRSCAEYPNKLIRLPFEEGHNRFVRQLAIDAYVIPTSEIQKVKDSLERDRQMGLGPRAIDAALACYNLEKQQRDYTAEMAENFG